MGLFNFWQKKMTSLDLFKEVNGGRTSRTGVTVNVDRALQVATVLACVRCLANGVAQVPFRVHVQTDRSRKVATEHPLHNVLKRRPNPWQTSFELRETAMFHMLLCGNAYMFLNRVGRLREIREIIPIEPGQVAVKRLDDMTLEYHVTGKSGKVEIFPAEAIWHIKGPSWNSWVGMDAVKLAREAIGLSIALEESQADFQKNGAKTSGVIATKSKLSVEKYKEWRAYMQKEIADGDKFRPWYLDDDARFTPFTMSGVDQQLLETRKFQIEEICREYGVMPIMIGFSDKAPTYASAEQMFLAHKVHSLDPLYKRIEESADVALLSEADRASGHYTKFTVNGLMHGAAKDRSDFYTKGLGNTQQPGWLTRNEVREWEELDPVDGGDEFPPLITTQAPADPGQGGNNGPN